MRLIIVAHFSHARIGGGRVVINYAVFDMCEWESSFLKALTTENKTTLYSNLTTQPAAQQNILITIHHVHERRVPIAPFYFLIFVRTRTQIY